jgi:hypothetical protein
MDVVVKDVNVLPKTGVNLKNYRGDDRFNLEIMKITFGNPGINRYCIDSLKKSFVRMLFADLDLQKPKYNDLPG